MISPVEQSYQNQCEEFHHLNENLQLFLNDMKLLDEQNRHYEQSIETIRRDYVNTLEYHLKRLPADFRQESEALNDAHLERYRSKSRARRFLNEREELKKRIQFLVHQDRERNKRIDRFEKQDQQMKNDLKMLNDQIHQYDQIVHNEKQNYRQAMDKLDQLYLQYEQICVDRSRTEVRHDDHQRDSNLFYFIKFEIQTLREEVKLMQTTKEFLIEEQQSLLSTQNYANEDFLARLHQSIARLKEDFYELNQQQIKQLENQYEQVMKRFEDEIKHQRPIEEITGENPYQIEEETLLGQLKNLNGENHHLADQILLLESDLTLLCDDRQRVLREKNDEFDQCQVDLERLNEKLTHLADYDRNLKFELTLYRSVLEGECRRRQRNHSESDPIQLNPLRKSRSSQDEVNEEFLLIETILFFSRQLVSSSSRFYYSNHCHLPA